MRFDTALSKQPFNVTFVTPVPDSFASLPGWTCQSEPLHLFVGFGFATAPTDALCGVNNNNPGFKPHSWTGVSVRATSNLPSIKHPGWLSDLRMHCHCDDSRKHYTRQSISSASFWSADGAGVLHLIRTHYTLQLVNIEDSKKRR